jgi:Domain of unknown function (DUF3943)
MDLMRHAVMFVPIFFTIRLLSHVHVVMAADLNPHRPGDAPLAAQVDVEALLRSHMGLSSRHSLGGPASLPLFTDSFASESSGGAEGRWLLPDENDIAGNDDAKPRGLERDWRGLGRDTAFFLGYQAVFAGVLYLLPESVTKWTAEQRKTSMSQWWENVSHPTWDEDNWYVNYLGHPYFGAIAYIRARERRFGAFGGFWYAALLSGLFEFGIEALFEQPSYQDLIVTPVAGMLIGALLFEPIRERIQGKPELRWYDHLTLTVTDPLGAANSLFERWLGIEADVQVQLRAPALAPHAPFDEPIARPLNRPQEQHRWSPGIGIEFVFEGGKWSAKRTR